MNPVPKKRPRVTRRGITYTPIETEIAERTVAAYVKQKMGPSYRPDPSARWAISCDFHCRNGKRGDLDNLLKLVLDALQGVLFTNDKSVVYLEAQIAPEASQRPGIAIRAWNPLPDLLNV